MYWRCVCVCMNPGRGPNYEPSKGGNGQEGLIEVDVIVEQLKLIPICQRNEIDD